MVDLITYLQIYRNCNSTLIMYLVELVKIIWVCCKNIYVNDLEDDEMHKCYSILYTCATTRGAVLDVVTDAHAGTLLLNLTQYISCRGCPKQILTDNGPVSASSKVQLFRAQRNIKLIFNPEEAPWFGGFWERLVGSVKRCIKKTTGCNCLTLTEMQTLFFEIEHILNSRPLTALFDNDNEQILTPNHLLYG